MLVKIECPECNSEGNMSLSQAVYEGPYRCWKCKKLFTIRLEDSELKSCVPFSEEELARQKKIEALKAKFRK
ncbi:hypothetical protein ACFLTJ_04090 [Chloroflexota bacterium]